MVQEEGVGHPEHCTEPVVWWGRFRTPGESIYRVDACEGHWGRTPPTGPDPGLKGPETDPGGAAWAWRHSPTS